MIGGIGGNGAAHLGEIGDGSGCRRRRRPPLGATKFLNPLVRLLWFVSHLSVLYFPVLVLCCLFLNALRSFMAF